MEKQNATSVVLLDLSAAFDTVDHDLLLRILESKLGITDEALKWHDSYLRPRGMKYASMVTILLKKPSPLVCHKAAAQGQTFLLHTAHQFRKLFPKRLT